MSIINISQPPIGLSFKQLDCTAENQSGAAISAGDLVLFDFVSLGDVSGAVKGDSLDPNDSDYYFGIVRSTPDVSAGTAAEDDMNSVVSYGIYGIALEDIPDAVGAVYSSGLIRVQGYVQANVVMVDGGAGAGSVGLLYGATESTETATTVDHSVMYTTLECTSGTKVLAIGLEAPADQGTEEKIWTLFDGIHGFGVMA